MKFSMDDVRRLQSETYMQRINRELKLAKYPMVGDGKQHLKEATRLYAEFRREKPLLYFYQVVAFPWIMRALLIIAAFYLIRWLFF